MRKERDGHRKAQYILLLIILESALLYTTKSALQVDCFDLKRPPDVVAKSDRPS